MFDFSNLSKISIFFDETNKIVIGNMKEESEGKIYDEIFGLKPKMYSIKNFDGKESNTTKGVNIATEFKNFKDTLFNEKVVRQNEKNSKQKT